MGEPPKGGVTNNLLDLHSHIDGGKTRKKRIERIQLNVFNLNLEALS